MPLNKTLFHDRTVISITGADRISYLQGIITQDVSNLDSDHCHYSALLTPQGKMIADFFILPIGEEILLDCAAEIGAKLLARLKLYKLRAQLDVMDVSNNWKVGAIWQTESTDVPLEEATSVRMFDDPRLSDLGKRFLIATDQLSNFETVEADQADASAYARYCISLGVPAFGNGFTSEDAFPLDVNFDALNGVDYKKGCFVGQEVASRMKRKGEVRKRTWIVTSEEEALEAGQSVMSGETTIGEITAAQQRQGLAIIRRDRLAKATAPFTVGENSAVTLHEPTYLGETA